MDVSSENSAELAARRRRFEDGWPFILSGLSLVALAVADHAGLPDILILAALLFLGWVSPSLLVFLRRHTTDARLGYVAEPPTPPSAPPTTREGMIIIVVIVVIGISMMIRNATGRDPLAAAWAWLGYCVPPAMALLVGVLMMETKTEAALPLRFLPLAGGILASVLTLWLAPRALHFSILCGAMGVVLLLDGIGLLARTLRNPARERHTTSQLSN